MSDHKNCKHYDFGMLGLWVFLAVWYLVEHADAVARMLGH